MWRLAPQKAREREFSLSPSKSSLIKNYVAVSVCRFFNFIGDFNEAISGQQAILGINSTAEDYGVAVFSHGHSYCPPNYLSRCMAGTHSGVTHGAVSEDSSNFSPTAHYYSRDCGWFAPKVHFRFTVVSHFHFSCHSASRRSLVSESDCVGRRSVRRHCN